MAAIQVNNKVLEKQTMSCLNSATTIVAEEKSRYYTATEFRRITKADLHRLLKKHGRM
ncbi:MAG: hypothetical protein LBM68_03190 [Bacteroidales bacterium]|jgi:hypothetical protein|nr:hypothetical protein [Bacteroidales bacterium]